MSARSAANTWDRAASIYDRQFGPEYQRLIQRICGELRSSDEIVDIACGTGLVALEAAAICRSVVGLDLSERMIEVANRKKTDLGKRNMDFFVGDAMDLSGQKSRFDAAILCNMLHVVEDPLEVLRQALTLLNPCGRVILATYCHGEASRFRDRLFSFGMRFLHRLGQIPSLHIMTFDSVLAACSKAGFIIEKSVLLSGEDFPCAFVVARPAGPPRASTIPHCASA